jgi:proton-translocating NADH-quinone oxidoreductase, chain N
MSYLELLKLALPETILVATAFFILVADRSTGGLDRRLRFRIGGLIASVGCALAAGWIAVTPAHANVMNGLLVIDPLTRLVKAGILILTILTVLLSSDSDFTEHVGEYMALILFAAVGMMFLVSAEDILMIFVSLELTSLSLYILTAFNKRNIKSAEAALKYFLFGGMAAAFTLFGLSLVYGLSGSTNLHQIAAALAGKGLDPLLVVAVVMTIVGFGFKVAAVPFHLWAPDAYEGAPAPSAAFIASGSKVASFFIFAKLLMIGFAGVEGSGAWRSFVSGWIPTVAVIAGASMILGNLAAIVQGSVRRLLAYSAIAHAGYALLGIAANNEDGVASLLYYVLTYGLTTVGAFGVIAVVENRTGGDTMSHFAGLSRRAPLISFCMFVFLLSLAGIPPLAGFFGKFYLFAAAVKGGENLGLLWLVILAIATSAVSLYYYLKVLKQIYVAAPETNEPVQVPILQQIVLGLIAAAVVILGCVPAVVVDALKTAIQAAGH